MTLVIPANTLCADAVLDWNAHAAKAIVTVGGQVPPRALIRLAMVHLAIYDAVNAIEGAPFEGYASIPTVDGPASEQAAVATAAHDVLVALFPRRRLTSTQSTRQRSQNYLTTSPGQMGSLLATTQRAPSCSSVLTTVAMPP